MKSAVITAMLLERFMRKMRVIKTARNIMVLIKTIMKKIEAVMKMMAGVDVFI